MTRSLPFALAAALLAAVPAAAQPAPQAEDRPTQPFHSPVDRPGEPVDPGRTDLGAGELQALADERTERYLARINDVMTLLYDQMSGPWQRADIPDDVRERVNDEWGDVVDAWGAVRRAEGDAWADSLQRYEQQLNEFTTAYERVLGDIEAQQAGQ